MRLPDGLGLRAAAAHAGAAARRTLHRHDRLRLGRERGRGAQGRRLRLPDQAGRPEAVPRRGRLGAVQASRRQPTVEPAWRRRPAPRRRRAGAERQRVPAAAAAAALQRLVGDSERDARGQGAHRQGGAQHGAGAGARRVGHRQGAGGARHPRLQPARRRPVRRGQLRRHPRDAARGRVLRRPQGLLHRRQRRTATATSRPRAAARCSSTRSATCRWRCSPSCCARSRSAACARSARRRKTPVDVRIVSATHKDLAAEVPGRALPPGPVLPPERDRDRGAAAARAARGPAGACEALLARIAQEPGMPARRGCRRAALAAAGAHPLARQRARTGEPAAPRRGAERRRRHSTSPTAACAERLPPTARTPTRPATTAHADAVPDARRAAERAPAELPSDLQAYLDQQEREILVRALREIASTAPPPAHAWA